MKSFVVAIAIGLLTSLPRAQTQEQTTPHTASPDVRGDFSGTWSIDRSISNDPQQATFEPAQGSGGQRGGGGGYSGGSNRRGGFGGSSSNRSRPSDRQPASAATSMTSDERARFQALTDSLKTASASLVISHHEPEFVVSDSKNQTQFFKTDGSTAEIHLGAVTMTGTTHWEGSRLVTTYILSDHDRLLYTYTLLPATKQLVLRVRRDVTDGQRGSAAELKLVYNLSPSAS